MKIKKLIMISLIVAATASYANERTDTIKQINKIIDNAIIKAIENDKTNPYLKQSRIKDIKGQVLTAIKKDLDEPGLSRLDIPEILPKIDKEIKKIGDGIGPKNNYRIIQESKEVIQPIEKTAYEGFLRVVDEQNRMNGIKSNYWEKGNVKAQRTHNGVDLVPIAHEEDLTSEYKKIEPPTESKVRLNSTPVSELAEKGIGAFSKEYYSELSYQNSDQFYGKRFYFGAGNTVKDIVFLDKENFSSKVENSKKNKNEKYYIEGEYKLVTTNATDAERANSFGAEKEVNPLDITMKEYRTRIQGKSKAQVSAFLKEKMAQKNIKNVVQQGEDLYTVDDKGRKWKIDWNLEPVSIESGSKDEYKDSVFTTINYYNSFDDKSGKGKLLYTKDGSIYAQDKNKYTDDVSLKLTETETKFVTKDKKMVRATKITEKFIAELTPAEYEARKNEFSDRSKYKVEQTYDYNFDEVFLISEISKVSKDFDIDDKENIKKFKGYTGTEEIITKKVTETVKTNKEVTKNLNEYIRVAKERAEKGEIPRNQFDQYFYDKKNLTKEAFENKWVKPFKNPDYLKAKENYERELAETRKKMNELEPEYKKAIDDEAIAYDMPNRPSDFYGIVDWPSKTEQQKKAYLNTLTPAGRKYVENWVKAYEKRVKLHAKYFELNALIADGTIAKKYGFWDNPAATAEQKKYVNLGGVDGLIKDLDLTRSIAGKNVEFRGIGRIEGTVDLGKGKNTLKIAEQVTGQYGTSITLGPYAKLKNIDTVEVGGSLSLDDSQASISGRTSLKMDIDPTKKNSEGHYYQHALKDSDPNIRFIKYGTTNMDSRNDFTIELLTSKITENEAVIDMGRKIDYTWYDMKTGKDYDMTIPFVSDSIAHQLVNNKKFSKKGTSLLELKTREEIKRLDSDENAVYRSIRNANKLGVLAETLTASNKKTIFNTVDEEKEAKKKKDLITYLKTKTNEELVNDLSQFNLSETEKKEALNLIKNLKDSKDFKALLTKEKELNKKLSSIDESKYDFDTKSALYGAGAGLVEGATEKLFAPFKASKKLFGKGIFDSADDMLIKKGARALQKAHINNEVAHKLSKIGVGMAEEGAEEVISSLANPLVAKATYDKNALQEYKTKEFYKNLGYDFAMGSAMGGALGGTGAVVGKALSSRNNSGKLTDEVKNNIFAVAKEQKEGSEARKRVEKLELQRQRGYKPSNDDYNEVRGILTQELIDSAKVDYTGKQRAKNNDFSTENISPRAVIENVTNLAKNEFETKKVKAENVSRFERDANITTEGEKFHLNNVISNKIEEANGFVGELLTKSNVLSDNPMLASEQVNTVSQLVTGTLAEEKLTNEFLNDNDIRNAIETSLDVKLPVNNDMARATLKAI